MARYNQKDSPSSEVLDIRSVDTDNLSQRDLDRNMSQRLIAAQNRRLAVVKKYQNEPQREVIIAPSYAKYWGKVMTVTINGAQIAVPCNGKPIKVPETYACEIDRRRQEADRIEQLSMNLADVQHNQDHADSPGLPVAVVR